MNTSKSINRLSGIDTIRGITILSMIAFHTCWDLMYFSMGVTSEFLYGPLGYIWQQSICYTFILLAGYSFSLGSHHVKRGLLALGGGIVISIVTILVMYDARDIFGVLILLGSSTLIMILLDKILPKSKKCSWIGLVVSVVLFVLLRDINDRYIGFEGFRFFRLSSSIYKNYLTTYLGFPFRGFYSSDYFSLFPWFFLYATGYFISRIMHNTDLERRIFSKGIWGLKFIGRHSLFIYMIHQVVIYAVVYLLHILVK